ncbi:MAG: ABC transporter substrate-binding protein [Eubacterium sp.]|nr:ABC transporter substrate-binding protein [Eubacterium sp.]
MKNKFICAVSALCVAAVCLTGCDKIMLVPGQSSGSISDPQSSAESKSEISEYPVILNDTEITASPQTVISLTPAYTEILFEMGYGDRLIAVSDYCDYPAETEGLPTVSGSTSPDIAQISRLKPELLITATPMVTKDKAALEALGIKVLTIPAPVTLEQFESIYKLFGLAFEGLFTGEEKGEHAFDVIKKSADKAEKGEKVKFAYITAALSPAGGNTFESAVLSLFGENVAEKGSAYDFPAADLAKNQPDVIFLNDEYTLKDLQDNKTYASLDAVKNGKVIVISNKYFERPSARITELVDDITAQLGGENTLTEQAE